MVAANTTPAMAKSVANYANAQLIKMEAIADGYVSVTPLHLDLTHDASLEGLRERFA